MAEGALMSSWSLRDVSPRRVVGWVAIAFGILALTVDLRTDPQSQPEATPPFLLGAPVESSEGMHIAAAIERYLDGAIELTAGDRRWRLTRRDLGIQVDRERLETWVREGEALRVARHRTAARAHGAQDGVFEIPVDTAIDVDKALEEMLPIAAAIDTTARNASFDVANRQIVPERVGHRLDRWASLAAIQRGLDRGATEIALITVDTAPLRRAEQLAGLRVEGAIGHYATHYSMLEEAADRTHNLRLIAEKVNGTVLLPGEEFDFNQVVGERNRARGFRPAPVIAGGELVDGVGGGACQVAGTLHAAAFFAGLPIVERSPHSRPSSYIRLGLDAAVAFPKINFRFRNDRDYPIAIEVKLEGGQVHASLLGPAFNEIVSFVRRIEDFKPYEERWVETDELPTGVRVLSQRGVAGFKVSRWRIRRDPAINQAIREGFEQDLYPPTAQVWKVGLGGPAPEGYAPPEGDTHPEYTADEYLVVTQGAGLEEAQVTRRPGRMGTPGWTVREGMAGVTSE